MTKYNKGDILKITNPGQAPWHVLVLDVSKGWYDLFHIEWNLKYSEMIYNFESYINVELQA